LSQEKKRKKYDRDRFKNVNNSIYILYITYIPTIYMRLVQQFDRCRAMKHYIIIIPVFNACSFKVFFRHTFSHLEPFDIFFSPHPVPMLYFRTWNNRRSTSAWHALRLCLFFYRKGKYFSHFISCWQAINELLVKHACTRERRISVVFVDNKKYYTVLFCFDVHKEFVALKSSETV